MKYTDFLEFVDESNPADVALLREYVALANQIGMPAAKFDSALRWVKANGTKYSGDHERARTSFLAHMEQDGVDRAHVNAIIDWHTVVTEHGVLEHLPGDEPRAAVASGDKQAELSPDSAARLAEIRAARRADPDAYEAEANAAVRAEELALLSGEPRAAAQDPRSPATRLAEIRQLRRDDPHAYDTNRAMQGEELALIAGTLPASSEPQISIPQASEQGASNAVD